MITKRQYQILSFFLTRALFFGLGITKIFNQSRNDAWISGILGTILGLILISFIYYLKSKNPDFSQKLNNGINGFITKLLIFLFASFCLHDVILSLTTMTSSFLLPLTPALVIAIAVLITIIYGNLKGISSFAKVAQILLPISIIIFSFKVISSLIITDYNNFLPLFYGHKMGILKASLVYALLSASPSLLLINVDKVKLTYKESILGYLIGSITIILSLISINGVLGPTLANILRFPEYMTLKKLRIYNFIENIENILTFTWLFDLIILGFMSAYNIKKIIKETTSHKDSLTSFIYFIWLILIMFVGVCIFNKHYNCALVLYNMESYIIFFFVITISLFAFLVKKKKSIVKT